MATDKISSDQIEKLGRDAIIFDALSGVAARHMARMVYQACEDINVAERQFAEYAAMLSDKLAAATRHVGAGERTSERFIRMAADLDEALIKRQAAWGSLGRLVGDEKANELAAGKPAA
jgi:hypothetical protein